MSGSLISEADSPLLRNALFPVFLKLEKLNMLVVGGGNVALEKLNAVFLNCPNAKVRLVASEISAEVQRFLSEHAVPYEERPFEPADLKDTDLVIVAINDRTISKAITEECNKRNILANVADTPDYCDFYLSSVVQKGHLKIAISTNGKSPTIAKRVKEVLTESFPDEMDQVLDNMQKIRNTLSGDFADKVKQLNAITTILTGEQKPVTLKHKVLRITGYFAIVLILMVLGYFLFSFFHL